MEEGRSSESGLRVGSSFPREALSHLASLKCCSKVGLGIKPHPHLKSLNPSIKRGLQSILRKEILDQLIKAVVGMEPLIEY